jgi:hypothetical protein
MDLLAIGLVALAFRRLSRERNEDARETKSRRERESRRGTAAPVRTRPYPAVRGIYTIAGLGVLGAIAEFGGQLFR